MRKVGETPALCVQQITNPEIVLVNYVVILDIVLPYIVWTALILKRNIGLPEALKTPIGRIVIPCLRRGYTIPGSYRPSWSAWREILACRWINGLWNLSFHIRVVAVQHQ